MQKHQARRGIQAANPEWRLRYLIQDKPRKSVAVNREITRGLPTLMSRVFEVDVLACTRCGGRMRILAAIDSPAAIHKILTRLGLPMRAPPIAPAESDPATA